MIEIEDLSLDEWYKCLKPYQSSIIRQLVDNLGEEKAAEEWITAMGPLQTATFGGDPSSKVDQKSYWNRLKEEFDKFICGHSAYENEHEKFLSTGKLLGTGAVTSIATWLSPSVGLSPTILVPAILLLLHTTAKISVRAYCATKFP
jgi:hypothetical protein